MRLIILWLSTAGALVLSLLMLNAAIAPPAKDIEQLVIFMGTTGSVTVGIAYIVHQQSVFKWLASLRWSLLLSIILSILLVLTNVWITAQLMFISEHDFYIAMSLLFFGGLTSTAFGMYVADSLTRRLRTLSDAAQQVATGNLSTRLNVTEHDELAEFAHTFNWMAQSLEKIDEEKRQIEKARRDLIAGVSHDLRTPITAVRARLEAIQDGIVTEPEEVQTYITHSLSEVQHLNLLINDLFELAQLDTGQLTLDITQTSLSDLLSDAVSRVHMRATQSNLVVHHDIASDVDPVAIAPDKIQRVIHNLLDNAVRYTPSGEQITLRAWRQTDHAHVEVHNTGITIEQEHLPHIFDSFYRVDESRQAEPNHRGAGLGLAIAKGFIEAHQGEIYVKSSPQKGTIFGFRLPTRQSIS